MQPKQEGRDKQGAGGESKGGAHQYGRFPPKDSKMGVTMEERYLAGVVRTNGGSQRGGRTNMVAFSSLTDEQVRKPAKENENPKTQMREESKGWAGHALRFEPLSQAKAAGLQLDHINMYPSKCKSE